MSRIKPLYTRIGHRVGKKRVKYSNGTLDADANIVYGPCPAEVGVPTPIRW